MQRELARGAASAVIMLLLGALILAQPGSGLPQPRFNFVPPGDGIAVGVLSIMATVVVALQLAVRTRVQLLDEASDLARRRFISQCASVLVPVTIGGGIFLALSGFEGFPEQMNLARVTSCVAAGLILAVIAADAGMAYDDEPHGEIRRAVRDEEWLHTLRDRERFLSRDSCSPSPAVVRGAVIIMIAVPIVLGLAAGRLIFGGSAAGIGGTILFSTLSAVLAYGVTYDVFITAARGTWSYLAPTTMMSLPFFALFCLLAATARLQHGPSTLRELAVPVLAVVLMFVIPVMLMLYMLGTSSAGKRRAMRQFAVSRAKQSRMRAERRSIAAAPKVPMNKLARASVLVGWIFPFGIVLGSIARGQIDSARTSGSQQGGDALIRIGAALSWGSLGLLLALLLAGIVIDVPVLLS